MSNEALTDEEIDEEFMACCNVESAGRWQWYIDGATLNKSDLRGFVRNLVGGRALASLPEGAPNPDSIDAKRYRWLKTNKLGYNGMAWHWMPGEPLWNDNLDAAIDEATKP